MRERPGVLLIDVLQCLCSLSGRTSYCKILWSLETARFGFRFSNCSKVWQAPRQQQFQRDTIIVIPSLGGSRFGGKTSYRLVNRGPGLLTTEGRVVTERVYMTKVLPCNECPKIVVTVCAFPRFLVVWDWSIIPIYFSRMSSYSILAKRLPQWMVVYQFYIYQQDVPRKYHIQI